MIGFEREKMKNPGVLKSHLHFLDGNSLQFYIQNYFFFLNNKKRNCRESCIGSVFKSLVAEIIKVPIRLY